MTRPHRAPVQRVCDPSISAQMLTSDLLAHVLLTAPYHHICVPGMMPRSFRGVTLHRHTCQKVIQTTVSIGLHGSDSLNSYGRELGAAITLLLSTRASLVVTPTSLISFNRKGSRSLSAIDTRQVFKSIFHSRITSPFAGQGQVSIQQERER